MIVFSQYQKTFAKLKEVIERIKSNKKSLNDNLPDTLYILGAASSRGGDLFISPHIKNGVILVDAINRKFPHLSIYLESIGNPPQKNWIAFTPRARDKWILDCAKISLFIEAFINKKINLTR